MIYALDTEFIDTPHVACLLSLALVAADGRELYVELPYDDLDITPWLRAHVVSQLTGKPVTMEQAAHQIRVFVGMEVPEIWAYYAAHDWFWFCRVFGGMMEMPQRFPMRCRDFANYQEGVPDLFGPPHHALNDAKSLMAAMKKRFSHSRAFGP